MHLLPGLFSWLIVWKSSVSLRNDGIANRPFDSKQRIIPAYPSSELGPIALGDLVENLGAIRQRLESVSDAFGRVKHFAIRGRQFHGKPFAVTCRCMAKIKYDVVNATRAASNQF